MLNQYKIYVPLTMLERTEKPPWMTDIPLTSQPPKRKLQEHRVQVVIASLPAMCICVPMEATWMPRV